MQLSTHHSAGLLRPCLEGLWTDWLCRGTREASGWQGGVWRHLAEMIGGAQGPQHSDFPPDTPGIVVPAVPSRFMVEVALGGQC